MSQDAVAPTAAARPHRRVSAFHSWRRARPFWGGLLMMLAGAEIFLSSNEDLGNIHVQIGVTGFLSYIVPLFVILCGALTWATPPQRMLYGILAIAASIYSVIAVNLGGFLIGMLLGIVGGSLAVAWVPDKFSATEIPAQRLGEPDDSDGTDRQYEPDATTDDFFSRTDDDDAVAAGTEDPTLRGAEGKQGARFPGPRRPVSDEEVTRSVGPSPLPRRSPRTVAVALVLALIGAVGFMTVHAASPAAAADCVPPTLTQLVKSAKASPAKAKSTKPGSTKASSTKPGSTKASSTKASSTKAGSTTAKGGSSGGTGSATASHAAGKAPLAAHPQASGGPISGLLGGLGGLLGLTPSASPSDSPSDSPSAAPSTSAPTPPAASTSPTKAPSPGGSPSAKPTGSPSGPSAPAPSNSASCDVTSTTLPNDPGVPLAGTIVSTQKAALLTMHNLTYDGNYELKTKSGPIAVMQFSMDSSTSTPFQLDSTVGGKTLRTTSSELTVSGNVTFYATEIKGIALGVLPQDYTPDNPPPLVPSEMFFTDVTIGLALVTCDTLTADDLHIGS